MEGTRTAGLKLAHGAASTRHACWIADWICSEKSDLPPRQSIISTRATKKPERNMGKATQVKKHESYKYGAVLLLNPEQEFA
ncbi:unnamed protein product [Chondrus crispus]|uniref:Uncharacterized protein n=1 Tax=Chondrus crispus TaxID=2769 RepID=R7QE49_CHOCR|nr:unnamed protein product [Chondrus crispus]CDF36008.1 unnamed protein product [Chondrus crispus]|eukprot:XP_005715827.1 unnamed protein product [Chondrus crispus]